MGSATTPPLPERVAILPLRNSVLFPMSVVPINVGRQRSVRLVEDLMGRQGALVGVLTQRNSETVEPRLEDLYQVGTLGRVVKVIRLTPSSYSVVLNGLSRFRALRQCTLEPYLQADILRVREVSAATPETRALAQELRQATRQVLEFMPNIPRETAGVLDSVREPGALADLIASNFPEEHAPIAARQRILEAFDVRERVDGVLKMVQRQLQVLKVKAEISTLVQEEMSRTQRDIALRQHLKSIREELGESLDEDDIEALRERIFEAGLPEEALKAARKQLGRLSEMQAQSAEYQVARTYVEWLADLPWNRTTPDRLDVESVRRCLNEDHYGLDSVKKRIIEYSAVRQLRADRRGPILLFVGPPGVGKTSLGRSIARAMGRRYGRIALGGVRDEAEIRGHRRTYVGALPGRIIQALKKAGTKNPVLVLDEVDKMGVDLRGDPASALLEVLDPEQNHSFVDHYIDLPFDLSLVTFLATANYRENIPAALRDRMEMIDISGYTRTEKRNIATSFLVPKQIREHGLTKSHVDFETQGIDKIIDYYTHEAGVRGLEREIASICRAVAVAVVEEHKTDHITVNAEKVVDILGTERHHPEDTERQIAPGVAVGLASTGAGGEVLLIEATRMPGKGEVFVTGSLRSVMKESATTAVSFVRANSEALALDPEWPKSVDLHLHVPRGASVYDAASSGVTMFVAVTSLLLQAQARSDVAVIGEITLRGRVLPVSGIKEKVLAGHRAGIRAIVLPRRNERDLPEVPEEVRADLALHFVDHVREVLPLVLSVPRTAGDQPGADEACL